MACFYFCLILKFMEKQTPLKSVIDESKKWREQRGENFFENKKQNKISSSQIQCVQPDHINFKSLIDVHSKINEVVDQYDRKILEQNAQVIEKKKYRSKSIHVYVDERLEKFLKDESSKMQNKWGLRKNAGVGAMIQKFILNYIEIKSREEKQINKVKKLISDFRANLVEYKKYAKDPMYISQAERVNQKMKILSKDLTIFIGLLEYEESALKLSLGMEQFDWLNFIIRWKHLS